MKGSSSTLVKTGVTYKSPIKESLKVLGLTDSGKNDKPMGISKTRCKGPTGSKHMFR